MTSCNRALIWLSVLLWMAWGVSPVMARITFDAQDIKAWADDVFSRALAERRMSGLAMTVVQDGQIVFAQTYGNADPIAKTPINPDSSKIRIASISKVFTATAIAQLEERGLIDSLDDPANKYLKRVQLPDAKGPITIWDLLTHRAGFEEKLFGLYANDNQGTPVTKEWIERYMPQQVRQPGTRIVYANMSTALLGILLEDVTGQSFSEYMRGNILLPFGMSNSTLNASVNPLPDQIVPAIIHKGGAFQALEYVPSNPLYLPGGGIDSTLNDMAKFMIGQLAGRQGVRSEILSKEGFEKLHRRKVENFPGFPGVGMQFFVDRWNGENIVFHGGAKPGFESDMILLLDSNAGIFFSVFGSTPTPSLSKSPPAKALDQPLHAINSKRLSGYGVSRLITQKFLGEYTPHLSEQRSDEGIYPGIYQRQRKAITTVEKLIEIARMGGAQVIVKQHPQGGLIFNGDGPYKQISPGVFWMPVGEFGLDDDPYRTVLWGFEFGVDGAPVALHSHLASDDVYLKVSALQDLRLSAYMLAGLIGVGATAGLAIFWGASVRGEKAAKWISVFVFAAALGLVAAVFVGFDETYRDFRLYFMHGKIARFWAMVVLANLLVLAALASTVITVQMWRQRFWGSGVAAVYKRLHFTVITITLIVLIPIFYSFNLIGIHLP